MIRAELFKARMTRSVWVLGGLGVAFCVAWAALQVFLFHQTDDAYTRPSLGLC
jgi:hypothetical protein